MDDVVCVKELARRLKVSRWKIYRMEKAGTITALDLGGGVKRYELSVVMAQVRVKRRLAL